MGVAEVIHFRWLFIFRSSLLIWNYYFLKYINFYVNINLIYIKIIFFEDLRVQSLPDYIYNTCFNNLIIFFSGFRVIVGAPSSDSPRSSSSRPGAVFRCAADREVECQEIFETTGKSSWSPTQSIWLTFSNGIWRLRCPVLPSFHIQMLALLLHPLFV